MDEEIIIGDKVYKLEEFYKLSNSEFENIIGYVKNLERDVIDRIRNSSISQEEYIKNLDLINKIDTQLSGVGLKRNSTNIRLFSEDAEIKNPLDEADVGFNEELDYINNLYSEANGKLVEKIHLVQDEKDKIIEELRASTPKKELTKEDGELVGDILNEYEYKSLIKKNLNNHILKSAKEQERNIKVMSSEYKDTAISTETVGKGIFARFRNFINTRLMPKRLEKKIFKDKQDKLKRICEKINRKIEEAKNRNKINDLRARIKSSMAIGLAAITMIGTTPSEIQEEFNNINDNIAMSIESDYDFSTVEDVASGAGILADEEILDDEAAKIYDNGTTDLTINQIRNIMYVYLDISGRDIPLDEKKELMKNYINEIGANEKEVAKLISKYVNERGDMIESDRIRIKEIMDITDEISNSEDSNSKEDDENNNEVETKTSSIYMEINEEEGTVITYEEDSEGNKISSIYKGITEEKSNYQKLKEFNDELDKILIAQPKSNIQSKLKEKFDGVIPDEVIEEAFIDNTLSKEEISEILKNKVLLYYLGEEEIIDEKTQDYEELESILKSESPSSITYKLKQNLKYIDENTIDKVSDFIERNFSQLTREDRAQIVDMVKLDIDRNYALAQLPEEYRNAYDTVERVMNDPYLLSFQKYDDIVYELKKYIPEDKIREIKDECYDDIYNDFYYDQYNANNTWNATPNSFGNINIQVTPEGDKYFIDENGEQIFVSDDVLDQMMNEYNNYNNYTDTMNYDPYGTEIYYRDKNFKDKLQAIILETAEKGEDIEIFNKILNVFNANSDPRARSNITKSIMDMPEIKELIDAKIITNYDINDIMNSRVTSYEKSERLVEIIKDGQFDLSIDEDEKDSYQYIKDGIEKKDIRFIDNLKTMFPLDDMKEVGVSEESIKSIVSDSNLSNDQKIRMVKEIVRDGNEKLKKLGYYGENQEEINDEIEEELEEDNER